MIQKHHSTRSAAISRNGWKAGSWTPYGAKTSGVGEVVGLFETFVSQGENIADSLPLMVVLGHGFLAKLYRNHQGFTAAKNSERHFVSDLCAFNDA
jgi:hypothetical protein